MALNSIERSILDSAKNVLSNPSMFGNDPSVIKSAQETVARLGDNTSSTPTSGGTSITTPQYSGAPNYDSDKTFNTFDPITGRSTSTTVPNMSNPANAGVVPVTTVHDPMQDYINSLKEAQRKSRIAALDTAKTNALSNLDTGLSSSMANFDTQQAAIGPQYYNKRNQAAAASDVGAMNFAQYMAARGITGNAGAMPEIYRNAGLQGQIGALDQAEASENADIERRRADTQNKYQINKTGIENAYQSDVSAANADVDAQGLQAFINQMNADRAYNLQAENQAFNQDMTQKQYNDTLSRREQQDYTNTVNRFYDDFQAEINKVQNDGDSSNDWQIPILESARQNKVGEVEANKASLADKVAKAQTEQEKVEFQRALDLWKTSGVADSYISSVLGVSVGARTADYTTELQRIANSASNANQPTTTEQRNADFANDYSYLKGLSVEQAVQEMNSQWADLIAKYGSTGARQLWNEVLADAQALDPDKANNSLWK